MQAKLSGGKKGKPALYFGALALIAGTVLSLEGYNAALLLVLLGCWVIMGVQQTPNRTAKQVIKTLDGKLPKLTYLFYNDGFDVLFDKNKDSYDYEDLSKIVKDREYFYLYTDSMVTLIIPKNAKPFPEELECFLQEKTGKTWETRTRSSGLFGANLYQLLSKKKL